MQIKLNDRLRAVAKLVLPGRTAADIGTDHSYLPVYLVINGVCPSVIATEKARGPFDNACQLVELLSLNRQIDMRLGSGLTVLEPGEADTITMAGMGGCVIRDILEDSPEVAALSKRLVLQPQKNVPMLRRYLQESGWRIVAEDIAFDHGFYYEIIAAEPGFMELDEDEMTFGPCLLGQPHPLLPQYLGLQLADMQTLLDQLEGKEGHEAGERRAALQNKVNKIESILAAGNGR
ncbi:MAG: class I SAM-dependent methyltransferase [Clostridiales bacterium]|nr:class I SAM-dependent methyltransferase [Clostridiales bacterium]